MLARIPLLPAIVLAACVAWSGCATKKEESTGVLQLRETATAAAAVYLCDVVHGPAGVSLPIRSVWRFPPGGAAPAPGTDLDILVNKSITDPAVTGALVFVYDPPLPLLNGNSMPNRTVYVFESGIPAFQTTVAEAESVVRSVPPPSRRDPSP